jgi:hypothetical protein
VPDKLPVVQLVKKFPPYEPKGSLPWLQEPTTGHFPELHKSNPHLHNIFFKIHFNNIFFSTPRSTNRSLQVSWSTNYEANH